MATKVLMPATTILLCIDCTTPYQVSKFASGRALRCPPCRKTHLRVYYAERHARKRKERKLEQQRNQMLPLHEAPHDSVKCYNCQCEPNCIQRIAHGLWVCCEVPDQRDYERLSTGIAVYDEELLKVSLADVRKNGQCA